jgi:hypothetical protein
VLLGNLFETFDVWVMSQNIVWMLLLFQPVSCREMLSISAYSGPFAPDFAPGFAPGSGSCCLEDKSPRSALSLSNVFPPSST